MSTKPLSASRQGRGTPERPPTGERPRLQAEGSLKTLERGKPASDWPKPKLERLRCRAAVSITTSSPNQRKKTGRSGV